MARGITYLSKNCMSQVNHICKRKRQVSDESNLIESPQKRQQGPAAGTFWDNLSKVWLTKRALREVDRRVRENIQGLPPPSWRQRSTTQYHQKKKDSVALKSKRLDSRAKKPPKDLKAFSRHGGPDLSDLRNYPDPAHRTMSSVGSSQSRKRALESDTGTSVTTRTKTTGTYDRDFQQHLVDHNIFPDRYEYPDGSKASKPDGWEDIMGRLGQKRASLSPSQFSDSHFENFAQANAHALKEKQVSEMVIPIIEGATTGKARSGGLPFTNLDPLTDGTLKPGNPDVFYGASPEQLDRRIRKEISGQVVPSTQQDLPIVPNFLLAAKGPDGTSAVAERQACYDGALGARGMHSLQSYGQSEIKYDNKAYTITSTYQAGQLKMFTSHPTKPSDPGKLPEYHMHQLGAFSMTNKTSSFREGATAYRNARDWAKEQRDHVIEQANERAKNMPQSADSSFQFSSSFAEVSGMHEPDEPASQTSLTSTISAEPEVLNIEVARRRSKRQGKARKRYV